ncbi:MAG: DUF6198 family protein [Bacteroidales bacterium]|nr:DUF6198 family protein [Bacteroidales bacterium]
MVRFFNVGNELVRRYCVFVIALFVSSLGVSLITRSMLGTSPISSIPYVLSIYSNLSMGTYTFILNIFLIAGQLVMLGKDRIREHAFDLVMQIPVSVLFGVFIDFTMFLLDGCIPEMYCLRLVSLVTGCLVLATGISLEIIADVTMLSGEYFVQIASRRFHHNFGTVKIAFDVSLVVIAACFSLLLGGHISGLREGTVATALLTGPFVRLIRPHLDCLLRLCLFTAV